VWNEGALARAWVGECVMAFVVFQGEDGHRAWQKYSLSTGCPVTRLSGLGGRRVLAVPESDLEALTERGIAFTVLSEAELPRHLSPGGLAYYDHLREHQPEYLYWNAPLPPALHVALHCNVAPEDVETVRQIVERHAALGWRTCPVTVLAVSLAPEEAEEPRGMVQVEFMVPRVHQQKLMEELMASGAAGTSRATAINVRSDPDGPPREGAEERHGG
jgi:hypothetical protein